MVGQVSSAEEGTRALKQELMEKVAEEANLLEALRRVCANKGSAGVDGMDVTELKAWMSKRAQQGTNKGEAHQRRLRTGPGAGSANSQARWQRGATIGHPDGGGSAGAAGPAASVRTHLRADLFGRQLWVPPRTRGARCVAAGQPICSRRAEHRGGPGLGEVLRPGPTQPALNYWKPRTIRAKTES